MKELETSLQQFGEFILKAQLVNEKAAPYCVRWVRRFMARQAIDGPLADQVRTFCEELEREPTGIDSPPVPLSMSRAERIPWRRSNSYDHASEPATIPIGRSAATRIG